MTDDIVLLMSELAANAVRHSGSSGDGGTFTARLLDVRGSYVLGEVEDGGSDRWEANLQGSARDASGLHLVLALATACGVSGDRHRRTVWFRVHYPSGDHISAAQGAAEDSLPLRAPGVQEPPFPVPRWDPRAGGQTADGREILEKVRAALVRL